MWGKPTDTGGNDPNFVVIIAYEVEISTDTTFLNVTAFKVTEDDFCVNRSCRMVLTSLVKGALQEPLTRAPETELDLSAAFVLPMML